MLPRIPRASRLQLLGGDVVHAIGDFLEAADHQALPLLDRLDEVRRLHERLVRAGVEPRDAAPETLDAQLSTAQILEVDVGDLELAARRRLEVVRNLDDLVVEEIQPCHRERRLRGLRLLFEADRAPVGVELDDAVALGIAHLVAEHGRAVFLRGGALQRFGKAGTVKDVVSERQRDRIAADELAADDERLREPIRARLHGILDRHAKVAPIFEQSLEAGLILRRRDDEDVANPRQHQRGQRVVNHGLVVDGQQLLAGAARQRVQAGARAASENDPFVHRGALYSLTAWRDSTGRRASCGGGL